MAVDGISAELLREHQIAGGILARDRRTERLVSVANAGLGTARTLRGRRSFVGLLRSARTDTLREICGGGRWRGALVRRPTTTMHKNLFLAGQRPRGCAESCVLDGQLRQPPRRKRRQRVLSVRHEQSGPQSAGSDRWLSLIRPRRRFIFGVVCAPQHLATTG
jgi:hypothetical protein